MKIQKNSNYQTKVNKTPCIQRVKKFFTNNFQGAKLKVLLEDVFDRTINRGGWFDYLAPSRDLPNCVSGPDEDYSYSDGGYIEFYLKDEEKMNKMTREEKYSYRTQLIRQKKYTTVTKKHK